MNMPVLATTASLRRRRSLESQASNREAVKKKGLFDVGSISELQIDLSSRLIPEPNWLGVNR